MSNFAIIMGDTGCGKSTSIKGLNPKETVIINVLGKRLPFKGSAALYNEEQKNLFKISNYADVLSLLDAINGNSAVKNVIMDDAIYIMRTEFFDRSKEKGYDKYNELADHFRRIIAKCGSLRDDLNIFMLLHIEPVESDGSLIGFKSASVGKLLDKQYNPLESVAVTLFAQPKYDDKGVPQFGFYTHKKKVNGVELPCKTPEGMFEDDFIPNDLGIVIKAMNEYYG